MGANEIVDLYLEGFKTFQSQTFHFLNTRNPASRAS